MASEHDSRRACSSVECAASTVNDKGLSELCARSIDELQECRRYEPDVSHVQSGRPTLEAKIWLGRLNELRYINVFDHSVPERAPVDS